MTPSERGRIIHKLGDLVLEHADELATLEAIDNGKPKHVARAADVTLKADRPLGDELALPGKRIGCVDRRAWLRSPE